MEHKVRIAVIGVGYLGRHHARIYSELPNVELVGVVDTHLERARTIAAEVSPRSNCRPFCDITPLFGRIDAASIVTPTLTHHAVATPLLEAGVHLLLEKPMTATLQEADDLIRLAKRKGAIVQVGYSERFNPGIRALRRYLTKPLFIECHRLGPFSERGADVHVILDLMIHDIDMVLSLISSDIAEIRASGASVLTDQIDIANARLAFKNGAVANLTASRVSYEKIRKIRIFQPGAYLSLNYAKPELVIHRRVIRESSASPAISSENIAIEKEEPLRAELTAFVGAVLHKRAPLTADGEEGRRTLSVALEIVDAIIQNSRRARNRREGGHDGL